MCPVEARGGRAGGRGGWCRGRGGRGDGRGGRADAPAAADAQQGADVEREQPGVPAGLRWPRHAGVRQELPDRVPWETGHITTIFVSILITKDGFKSETNFSCYI